MDLDYFPLRKLTGIQGPVFVPAEDCESFGLPGTLPAIEAWWAQTGPSEWVPIPLPVIEEMRAANPDRSVYRLYRNEDNEIAAERIRREINSAAQRVKNREPMRTVLPLPRVDS